MRTVDTGISQMGTEELEAYLDSRYEAGASQAELDALEVEYAERVSEEDLNMTEDDLNVSEEAGYLGGNLEIGLIEMYHRYLQPQGQRDGLMEDENIMLNIRANFEDAGFISGGLKDVSDSQLLEAAKEAYECRKDLIQRYKAKNKISNIPSKFLNRR